MFNDLKKQGSLFQDATNQMAPLAERMRPSNLDEFTGQEHLVGKGKNFRRLIEKDKVSSMILWGPPGSGKTSLARVIATMTDAEFIGFSAVISGIKEVKEVIAVARKRRSLERKSTILFIDEIHRFNKAQQDAFLPHVENGTIILIGATTENPSFSVISPLLSRCKVYVLNALHEHEIRQIVDNALKDPERGFGKEHITLDPQVLETLISYAHGDARSALNTLELVVFSVQPDDSNIRNIGMNELQDVLQKATILYDKHGDQHFDLISAMHKSIRGSDPHASLYWLARMLEGGEDPLYIARRLIRAASEDIGLADPFALNLTIAARDAVQFIGVPEANLALAQAAIYLACAPKSNALYKAYSAVREEIKKSGPLPVPLHIRNAPTPLMHGLGYGKKYKYPHDYPGAMVTQQYLPDALVGREFYCPTERGFEREVKTKMTDATQETIQEKIKRVLKTYNKVAVVGLSANPDKPSYGVAEYAISKGYEIIPVNPRYENILGKKSYNSLLDVPKPLEIVDVFRKPEDVMPVAEEAVKAGAKVFWMQLGIQNARAAEFLEKHGVEVIENRCIAQELRGIQ